MEKKINKILYAPKKNPAGKRDAKQALILFTRLPILRGFIRNFIEEKKELSSFFFSPRKMLKKGLQK